MARKLGRETDDYVTTIGSGTDNAVLRISTAYEVRGMVASVISYNNATPGSGTVLNQCALSYNGFRQLIEEQQEHSGAVTGSSANVQYNYASGTGSTNYIRLTGVTYPNGRVISYIYAAGRDTMLSRVSSISDTSAVLARYTYLGLGTVVRISYPQASVWLDLWGGTSGVFNGFDLFNRIIDQRWQNNTTGTPADIDRYQYGYDQDSNRLWKANLMTTGLDEFYAYDPLNRLTLMQRGTLNTGKTGITGTPAREMDYTLDPTGNWSSYLTKTTGTTDLSQTRTSNPANEITAVGGTPNSFTPAYDAAGNNTTFPQPSAPTTSYAAVYDAWNRMASLSASGTSVAKYQYDGSNRRSVKLTYTGGTLSETRHFYFTAWQDVEERVGASTSVDKQYVWGIRYVDELVCRDDGTPRRLYGAQDANFNLTGIADTSGVVQERHVYKPYGNVTFMNAAWNVIGSSGKAWDINYQGLLQDVESGLLLNRMRHFHPTLGRLVSREGGYAAALSLYEYARSNPICYTDPSGRQATRPSTQPSTQPSTGSNGNMTNNPPYIPNPAKSNCSVSLQGKDAGEFNEKHTYLVITNPDGSQTEVRGGPLGHPGPGSKSPDDPKKMGDPCGCKGKGPYPGQLGPLVTYIGPHGVGARPDRSNSPDAGPSVIGNIAITSSTKTGCELANCLMDIAK